MNHLPQGIAGWRWTLWVPVLGATLLPTWGLLSHLQWPQGDRVQPGLVMALAGLQAAVLLLWVVLLVRHLRRQVAQCEKLQRIGHELAQARDQADAANHRKSVLLADISHAIRTPFQDVLRRLDLLDETRLSSQQRDHVQCSRDCAQRLVGVLDDIRDVSAMETGALRLAPEPVNLFLLVQDAEDLMGAAAREKGLSLQIQTAPDLPEWVLADPARVQQILFNLLDHAVTSTHEGGITARLSRLPDQTHGICITVQDSGMGMDAATRAQLFTRFHPADNPVRRRTGGSGLGLGISHQLAVMMGGSIDVRSEPGQGSLFTVHLLLPEITAPALAPRPPGPSDPKRQLRVMVDDTTSEPVAPRLEDTGHSAAGPIDSEAYTEIVSTMPPDTLDGLLGKLFDPSQGSVQVLLASLAAGDATQIGHDAHQLKGTAMLLGFRALVRTSAQIERLAQEEDAVLRRGLGNQLKTDAQRTQQALRAFSTTQPA